MKRTLIILLLSAAIVVTVVVPISVEFVRASNDKTDGLNMLREMLQMSQDMSVTQASDISEIAMPRRESFLTGEDGMLASPTSGGSRIGNAASASRFRSKSQTYRDRPGYTELHVRPDEYHICSSRRGEGDIVRCDSFRSCMPTITGLVIRSCSEIPAGR